MSRHTPAPRQPSPPHGIAIRSPSLAAAPGAPGVAIGINQSACSLGSAIGPILCGLGYTASLARLATSAPFFVALGLIALAPGAATQALAPRWPW